MSRHRTTAMIQSLPDAGATILVPTAAIRLEVLRMLLELRGPEFDARCSVRVVTCTDDVQSLCGSAPQRMVWDHTLKGFLSRETFDFVADLCRERDQIVEAASSPSGAA